MSKKKVYRAVVSVDGRPVFKVEADTVRKAVIRAEEELLSMPDQDKAEIKVEALKGEYEQ